MTINDFSQTEFDLVIIGGGPTGLLSALLARQLGLSVCIFDSKPSTLDLGRADALNARTQQYLEVAGVLNEILPLGVKCNTSSTFANGAFVSRQSHWWTSLQHCLHKNFLMIGQPDIERIIASHLDIPICFNERVIAIDENPTHVLTTTSSGRICKSKYAIGADGARSFVRNALGIGFNGTKPEMVWTVMDVFIDTDFPVCNEIITFQLNKQSRVSWIPRERGLARFYVLLDGEISQAKAEASIKEHMKPYTVNFVKTEWFSTFDVKERIASTFISRNGTGRILLAGDAAHVHAVNGGQGLNTGIADAFSIIWRIAIALRSKNLSSQAISNLIRSYDIERRTVAQGVINVAAKLVRDTVHTAKEYVATIERNSGYITGMGVSYDEFDSPLIRASKYGIWCAGHRCPDIYMQSKAPERLYSFVAGHYGKYHILLIGIQPNIGENVPYLEYIRVLRLYHEGYTQNLRPGQEFTSGFVGVEDSYAVVIRPDMYIGYAGAGDGWKDYMKNAFLL